MAWTPGKLVHGIDSCRARRPPRARFGGAIRGKSRGRIRRWAITNLVGTGPAHFLFPALQARPCTSFLVWERCSRTPENTRIIVCLQSRWHGPEKYEGLTAALKRFMENRRIGSKSPTRRQPDRSAGRGAPTWAGEHHARLSPPHRITRHTAVEPGRAWGKRSSTRRKPPITLLVRRVRARTGYMHQKNSAYRIDLPAGNLARAMMHFVGDCGTT